MTIEPFKMDGSGVATHAEDPNILLVGDVTPKWIQVPEGMEYAGQRLAVLFCAPTECVQCKRRGIRGFILEHNLAVIECFPDGCGYVWLEMSS
jgi:hypothetical protein